MKKIYLFLIGILYCFPLWSETIHVSTPGDLREALMDADFNGTQLKITGTLNGADLAIIHAADGRLKNVTELDLSEVNFKASDDCYATYKTPHTMVIWSILPFITVKPAKETLAIILLCWV